jgi:DnaJ like chaperone protein
MKWIYVIIALIYLLSPLDIIPGIHPLGWLDDIVVLVLLLRYLSRFWQAGDTGRPPFGHRQNPHQQSQPHGRKPADKPNRTPHDILGVRPDADHQKIRAAYRELVNQYHPDKVAHLGEEFQKLAEERFKEIQQAYDTLIQP